MIFLLSINLNNNFKFLKSMKRTHTCGVLKASDVNKKATLCGWCSSRRDHGGVIFIDLRDRYGLTQVVFDPSYNGEPHTVAEKLGREDVIQVSGIVKKRKEGMQNPKMDTGEIEVFVDEITVLSEADTPPVDIDDRIDTNEDTRLKYRYLDLRKPAMQQNLLIRHKVVKAVRDYFDKLDFMEIETPILAKSTPEGARDYLVPSRVHPGKFYALPQSPQIFKQLLMVSGFDRYFQIARCFRDEDLRADRQPEFTQIDVEMSFVDEQDVMSTIEGMLKHVWRVVLNKDVKTPFQRITYQDSMERYGIDRPDTRFGLELVDVTDIGKNTNFEVFTKVIKDGGIVKCINAKGCANFSRKTIEELTEFVAIYGSKGLAWMKAADDSFESSIVKFFDDKAQGELKKVMKVEKGDLLLFVSSTSKSIVNDSLGNLRIELAKRLNLIDNKRFSFCWVVDFPLIEYNDEDKRHYAVHHPFTSPKVKDLKLLDSDPAKVKARAYDVVLNGTEIGGGSIRIHQRDIQSKIFNILGISKQESEERFGFLLEAFRYGTPPHGGIALGVDRVAAMITGNESIREVIAFPKNKAAESLMDNAPSEVDENQMKELHIKLDFVKGAKNEIFDKIIDALNREKAEHEILEHKAVFTSKEAAKVRGTELKQGCKALICKTDEGFIQAVVSGDKELDLEKLQKATLFKSLNLANAADVKKKTNCSIGSVPPFGNLMGLKVYFDKSVSENEIVGFNAGSHTKSIKMKCKDLVKIVNPVVLEFSK
jgi:aspartyl-tRNA synthetase